MVDMYIDITMLLCAQGTAGKNVITVMIASYKLRLAQQTR